MKEQIFNKVKKVDFPNEVIEVRVFQNSNNKQFNLPVLKKNTSQNIMKDVFNNKDVIGLKFKITDLILKNNRKDSLRLVPFKNLKGGKI